ncbi:unnamed protein product [Lathyrus oleraceus]
MKVMKNCELLFPVFICVAWLDGWIQGLHKAQCKLILLQGSYGWLLPSSGLYIGVVLFSQLDQIQDDKWTIYLTPSLLNFIHALLMSHAVSTGDVLQLIQ